MITRDDFLKIRRPTLRSLVLSAYFMGLGAGIIGSQVRGVFRAWWEPILLGVVIFITGIGFLLLAKHHQVPEDREAWRTLELLEGEDS